MKLQKILLWLAAVVLVGGGLVSSGVLGIRWDLLSRYFKLPAPAALPLGPANVKIVTEESVVISAVDKVSPAVVTIGITKTRRVGDIFEINPFDPFSPFQRRGGQTQKLEQDIGSGFIVEGNGLIVTNKHVVADTEAKYRVITKDDKTYEVAKIYRDPANDLAILKINPPAGAGLTTVEMGDSSKIKVGQLAIAIGTALGEFRNTVTTGVVSGIGRGITAGSPFEGYVEKLDNVIQTSAAISLGNSGGPLVNSSAQVVGVNTAVSAEGQNIGFAIPINVVRDALSNFNQTGQFNRPFLGVRYRMVTREISVLNEIPEGAYVIDIVSGSPAAKAGVVAEDIITKIDDQKVTSANDLAKIISKKKVGDKLIVTVYRGNKELNLTITLSSQEE